MSPSQGTHRIAGSHQKLGEKHGTDSPSEPPKVINTANTLILDFWPPEPDGEKNSVVLSHPVCGTLLWQPQESNIVCKYISFMKACSSLLGSDRG